MKKVFCIALFVFQLTGCDSKPSVTQESSCIANLTKTIASCTSSNSVWNRIVAQFSFKHHTNQKLVQTYINKYKKKP